MAKDRDTTRRRFTDSTARAFTIGGLLVVGFLVVVFHSIPVVVSTISALVTGGNVDHGFRDIGGSVLSIVGLPVMALAVIWPDKLTPSAPSTPRPTREEELEERRAWLADLRDQGAPWHERLGQRLSLTFVATPVMALRRSFRPSGARTPRDRVRSATISMIILTLLEPPPFGALGTTITVAVVLVVGCLAEWFVASPRRRVWAAGLRPWRRRDRD